MRTRRLAAVALVACVSLTACGHTDTVASSPARFVADRDWLMVRQVGAVRQTSETTCGAAALASVLGYWGKPTTVAEIIVAHPPRPSRGIPAGDLRDFARKRGLSAFLIAGTQADLSSEIAGGRPVLVGLVKGQGRDSFGHYAVVVGMRRDGSRVLMMDPAKGWRDQQANAFLSEWGRARQVTLVMFPITPAAEHAALAKARNESH